MELESSQVPELRVRAINECPVRNKGAYVLYWMVANRRAASNFSLQRAGEWARSLGRPLVVLEALRADYPWASVRFHQFVVEGMADNLQAFADSRVTYYPYVEPEKDAANGLIAELARQACVIVSDDFPCFFLPRMLTAVAKRLDVRMELVDSNGILPLRVADQVFTLAHSFRRYLQKTLRPHLLEFPQDDDWADLPQLDKLPVAVTRRWPATSPKTLRDAAAFLTGLPIDQSVTAAVMRGGAAAAQDCLATFVKSRLSRYAEERNQPDNDASSGLSPYLHFGHVSAHQVFDAVMSADGWRPSAIAEKATGSREGWWGASPTVEAFLDELITWRELGYNMCWQRADYNRYSSLPEWAQETLHDHRKDPRKPSYTLEQFEMADTHDPVWNAIQNQLRWEGRVHNYLRMLWGKKILHWSKSPQAALEIMIELNT
ncbi:MAG: deoxyribodipyrimidine photolyase, partial [Planctomycetales bacterium]|nr:deoxyribodipyrimidine photolyase [Planctomycetales bacterium]